MSVEAITWALGQQIEHSATKFVLVVLANCAGASFSAWPSISYLCGATSQDRKTVIQALKRLRDMGLIERSGEMKGRSGQVPVYLLNVLTSTENGTGTENGTSAKNGTGVVPKTVLVPVPKTVHGTVNRTINESNARPANRGTRLDATWRPSPTVVTWTRQSRPDLNLEETIEAFRDYWISKSGQGATKLDWDRTFRNWIRNTKPSYKQPASRVGGFL